MCSVLPASSSLCRAPCVFTVPVASAAMQAASACSCGDRGGGSRPSCDCESSAHRQIMDGMSHLGRAMAFAARIWDANRGRFSITLGQAKWYSEHIDAAIEIEHELICSGKIPRRRFTIGYVQELLATSRTSTCVGRDLSATSEAPSVEIL